MPKLLTQGVSSEPETGRSLIGIVAGFKSERWPDFDRNGGRLQVGIRKSSHKSPLRGRSRVPGSCFMIMAGRHIDREQGVSKPVKSAAAND
ncbi:hypothetical protein EPK84_13910 (plasmid) [Sinorhizobium fredii]|nr:hypothetical protein EPK84_13910 [Sinorhizobium fredii]